MKKIFGKFQEKRFASDRAICIEKHIASLFIFGENVCSQVKKH